MRKAFLAESHEMCDGVGHSLAESQGLESWPPTTRHVSHSVTNLTNNYPDPIILGMTQAKHGIGVDPSNVCKWFGIGILRFAWTAAP